MVSSPDYEVFEFSTRDTTGRDDRRDYWSVHVQENHGLMGFDFAGARGFDGFTVVQRSRGVGHNYQLVEFGSRRIRYRRTARHARADGDRSARLVLPLKGAIGLSQGRNTVSVPPGDVGVVRMDAPMGLAHDDGARALILSIPAGEVTRHLCGTAPLLLDKQRPLVSMLAASTRQLSAFAATMSAYEYIKGSEAVYSLLGSVLNQNSTGRRGDLTDTALRAEFLIRNHSDDPRMSPGVLANRLQCSLRHLHRALKTVLGTTPAALLRTTRVERAHARLRDPFFVTIDQVWSASGFQSASAFRAAFTEHYGVPPSRARNEAIATVAAPTLPNTAGRQVQRPSQWPQRP